MRRFLTAFALTVIISFIASGHAPCHAAVRQDTHQTTAAYGILAIRKAAVEAELETLSAVLTSQHWDVTVKRDELDALNREMQDMTYVGGSELNKLSEAYGKQILRKVDLEMTLKRLLCSFSPRHPDVLATEAELAALEWEIRFLWR